MSHAVSIEFGDGLTLDSMPRLIDSLPSPSSPPKMKLLVLGMPETHISPLLSALRTLSYTPFHSSSMDTPASAHLYPYWTEALSAYHYGTCKPYNRADYDKLFAGFDASCNLPGTFVWKDLIDAYPDAKIILTTRPVDEWVAAMDKVIDAFRTRSKSPIAEFVANLNPRTKAWWQHRKFQHGLRTHLCPRGEREAYVQHYDAVRKYVDAENLLEFNPEMGWEPLCEFLGMQVPETEFPVEGDEEAERAVEEAMGGWGWEKRFGSVVSTVGTGVGLAVAGAVGWWVARI
ncbi:hypothetical protein DE146DRAFT_666675 [Phaeosphaeria sp. MPI-PUGE-AT-0046c]|nr:hypothetical protein DE146DRAFT_666675 [Phaeosphaeria sp. MPI-PUGE-AT-0046c]